MGAVTETEEWRAVVGYEGLYEVSSLGRVIKCRHRVTKCAGKQREYSYEKAAVEKQRHSGGSRKASIRFYMAGRGDTTQRVVNVVLDAFGIVVPADHGLLYANGDEKDCSLRNLVVVPLTEPEEIWRDIPSAPGYQASSLGRIRSLTRRYTRRASGREMEVRIFGRLLAQPVSGRKRSSFAGYPTVNLSRPGCKGRSVPVHHLVAEAFHGPRPAGMWVLHRDGNSLNPKPNNLRYGSVRENFDDMNVKAFADLAGIAIEDAWAIIAKRAD